MASPSASPDKKGKASPAEEEHGPGMFEKIEDVQARYAKDLASVRALLTLPCPDDVMVYRFLRGHKFDVAVAAKHLQHTLDMRKEVGLDALRVKAEKLKQKQFPFADKVLAVHPHNISHGFDKKGQPLSIERLGYANPYLMVRTVPFNEMLQYHYYHMEKKAAIVRDMSLQSGTVIRTAKIMDFTGLGRQHLDRRGLSYLKKIVGLSQHAYPEMLGDLYMVNTPWIFGIGWKIISPWLNEKTLSKIHILDNATYQKVLREHIPAEHIPDWLGGECTCAGEGGCVPLRDPNEGLTAVQVPQRGKYEHTLRVDAAEFERLRAESASHCAPAEPAPGVEGVEAVGSDGGVGPGTFKGVTVRYEFRTVKNDLAFEIRSRPLPASANGANGSADDAGAAPAAAAAAPAAKGGADAGSWSVLKASKRYQSDSEPICSSFVLDAPAEILFVFDNSFSYFTGKSLLYRVEVDAAIEHPADPDEGQLSAQLEGALLSPPDAQSPEAQLP